MISNQFIFEKIASNGAIWAMIVEKAWSKAAGNYELIDEAFTSGDADEAFKFLLGVPV